MNVNSSCFVVFRSFFGNYLGQQVIFYRILSNFHNTLGSI